MAVLAVMGGQMAWCMMEESPRDTQWPPLYYLDPARALLAAQLGLWSLESPWKGGAPSSEPDSRTPGPRTAEACSSRLPRWEGGLGQDKNRCERGREFMCACVCWRWVVGVAGQELEERKVGDGGGEELPEVTHPGRTRM